MEQFSSAQLDGLRAAWSADWVRAASSGDVVRRDLLVDRYVELHSAAVLLGARASPGRLGDLVTTHERLGREMSPVLVGEIELTTAVLGVRLTSLPAGLLPVVADRGQAPPRVERSRPGWRLDGAVSDVAWDPGTSHIAVFAVDEGDNEVVAVLEVAGLAESGRLRAVHEVVGGRRIATVRLADVVLTEAQVVHVPGVRDRLSDRLAVLAGADALGAAAALLSRGGTAQSQDLRDTLMASRLVLMGAASAASMSSLVVSHHDVSAALVWVLGVCESVAAHRLAHPEKIEPATAARVDRIRLHAGLAPWHRRRLVPLI